MNHAKAIKELDNKQDKIHYRIDMYSSFISLKLGILKIRNLGTKAKPRILKKEDV